MKQFLIKWCIIFTAIFGVAIYYITTVSRHKTGDLGNIGHIPFGTEYNRTIHALEKTSGIKSTVISIDSASAYPLLIIGDSFFEPEILMGDVLANELDDTTYIIHDFTQGKVFKPTQILLYGLTHSCFSPGQVIILESVECSLCERFGDLDFNDTTLPKDLYDVNIWRKEQAERLAILGKLYHSQYNLAWPSINDILTWIRIQLNYKVPFTRCALTQQFFTHKDYANQLFVYNSVFMSCNVKEDELHLWADTANRLFALAEKQGIILYLLIIPDKYDLYYPYIYDRDITNIPNALDFLKGVNSNRIINARDTLAPLLEQNTKDVFQLHDTHWSAATSKYMATKIAQRLKDDCVLTKNIKP